MQHTVAARFGEKLAAVAKEASARRDEGEPHSPLVLLHGDDAGLARGERLHHHARKGLGYLGHDVLDGFAGLSVDLASDDLRPRDVELVPRAAHGLDQYRDLELAAARHHEDVRRIGRLDLDGDIAERLAPEPVADLTAGEEPPVQSRERRVVGREAHADGRGIDANPRQRLEDIRGADGVADLDRVHAGDDREVAGDGAFELDAPQRPRSQQLGHAKGLRLTGFEETGHRRPALEATPFHTADHEPAHELVVVEGHGLELQRPVDIDLRRRRVLDNGFQQRSQIRARLLWIQRCGSPLGRRVHDGEVELFVGSARGDEEIEDLVHDHVGPLLRAIHLVDDEQGPQAVGQRLPDDESSLGHHTLDGVYEQQHRVHHAEDALDLSAEVRVAGGVDEVDAHALEIDGGLLGEDRDPPLALDILAVHHPLRDRLVLAEGAGLAQQSIQQGRLAVINVGDDRQVAEIFAQFSHGDGGTLACVRGMSQIGALVDARRRHSWLSLLHGRRELRDCITSADRPSHPGAPLLERRPPPPSASRPVALTRFSPFAASRLAESPKSTRWRRTARPVARALPASDGYRRVFDSSRSPIGRGAARIRRR